MNIFERAKKAILKTDESFKNFAENSTEATNVMKRLNSARKNTGLRTFIFEYEVASTGLDGETWRSCRQKEVMSQHLQGAIRKLYLEAEPGFMGLKKIVWEG